MNNVLSLVRAARASSHPFSPLHSDRMLAELLALNEEMVEQLRLELLGGGGSAEFLAEMISQHESAVAMLRAELEKHALEAGRIGAGLPGG